MKAFIRENIIKPLFRNKSWSTLRKEHLKKQDTCQAFRNFQETYTSNQHEKR